MTKPTRPRFPAIERICNYGTTHEITKALDAIECDRASARLIKTMVSLEDELLEHIEIDREDLDVLEQRVIDAWHHKK